MPYIYILTILLYSLWSNMVNQFAGVLPGETVGKKFFLYIASYYSIRGSLVVSGAFFYITNLMLL